MQPELKIRKVLGKTYLNENRLADALDVFSRILEDYPEDKETLHILGNIYLASGDGRTAKTIYLRASQLEPQNEVIRRQILLAEEMGGDDAESIPTDVSAVGRLLQRLTGAPQPVSETDILRAASLLERILASEHPADLVTQHLDEIDQLLPALIELNIRQAQADGLPDLAESLRHLQINIQNQIVRKDTVMPKSSQPTAPGFKGSVLFLLPQPEHIPSRMALLKAALDSSGCATLIRREYVAGLETRPDLIITSNPHVEPILLQSLSALSNAGVPILLDLDDDFEKQPISHGEYAAKGLGTSARSNAYTSAISMARMVTVPSEMQAASLRELVQHVSVIPDGWSRTNKLWEKEPHQRGTLNIGWLGASGQLEDLALIRRYVIRILREFSNTRVVIIGNPQAYRLFDSLPENRRLYLPATAHEELPYQLSQLDILLVPLRNIPYNLSAPDTALMQAGARGIPWLASDVPAFRRWGKGGIISEALDEWHLNLRHLILDPDLRLKLGAQGRSAADTREMGQVVRLWLEHIQQVSRTEVALGLVG
jgi:glycosyltransferase involved in cell wall biosynthesis